MAQTNRPSTLADVFDRRLMITMALVALVGLMSCDPINSFLTQAFAPEAIPAPNPKQWKVGSVHSVGLTLITKDYARLDCASKVAFEGRHCKYETKDKTWVSDSTAPDDDNKETIIQPYRTAVGNHLVLVAGVWATPAVALRSHQEPFKGIADKKLRRFTATCKLRFVGSLQNVDLRWQPKQKWTTEKTAPTAIVEHCDVEQ